MPVCWFRSVNQLQRIKVVRGLVNQLQRTKVVRGLVLAHDPQYESERESFLKKPHFHQLGSV